MNELTIVIPAKNEVESLPKVLDSLKDFNCNITISISENDIDTINSIKNFNVNIYQQRKNGYGNALYEAIENCNTDYFCIFNADGSFEKDDLIKMYNQITNNDFVFASRYLDGAGSDDDTIVTYFGNKIFSILCKILFSLNINDILYTFILGKTKSFKKLKIISNDFRFCVELPIKMQIASMKYSSIPSYEKNRIAGKKKVNAFKDGLLILSEMLKLFFRYKLLRQKII